MKIGIFTDTYRPSLNGVVYVTEILRRSFEKAGHEVYIFAPAEGLTGNEETDPHIIRFPAISGVVIADFNSSVFFPPRVLKKIEELNLDILHFLTPGPIGLMALYAAHKLQKPIVAEYCTDYFEYVEHYPLAMPAILALGIALPFTLRPSREELKEMLKAARPRLTPTNWNQEMVKHLMTVVHSHCDAVITHSRKSTDQLLSWQSGDDHYKIDIIPTGVDPLPKPTTAEVSDFKNQWGITAEDEVVGYTGRLSAEKNLDMLIDMIAELVKWRPHAKLMLVGDSAEYRGKLEEKVASSPVSEHIIFTGKLPREQLGRALAAMRVFTFPSLTDTQSLAVYEAAGAGLPIVMIDEPVTEVLHDGVNGYFSKDDPIDMAAKVKDILDDPERYKKMSAESRKAAKKYSERTQGDKILKIYETIIRSKKITS